MNKLEALKFFVTAAETLNFRETAVKLAISPSVVTRTISELENQLGEPLFKRNTRSILLTSFGELFYPEPSVFWKTQKHYFRRLKIIMI